jgi:hypothetical protein
MISSPDIEFSMYADGVAVSVLSPYAGTTHPIGTLRQPVNNLPDAILITEYRGIDTFQIIGNITLGNNINVAGYSFVGQNAAKTTITIEDSAETYGCEIFESGVTGRLDGGVILRECLIFGYIHNCVISANATIVLGNTQPALIMGCTGGFAEGSMPTIDCGGSGQSLAINGYEGEMKIINKTGPEQIDINISEGVIHLDSTITQGLITIAGNCKFINDTTPQEGLFIDTSGLNKPVNDEYGGVVYFSETEGTSGSSYPQGLGGSPSNNILDVILIAEKYGCLIVHLHTTITIPSGVDVSYYMFEGYKGTQVGVVFENGSISESCSFDGISVSGYLNGTCGFNDCLIYNVEGLRGRMDGCVFNGSIGLYDDPATGSLISDCKPRSSNAPVFHIYQHQLVITNWVGFVVFADKTGPSEANIFLEYGVLSIDATCVNGFIFAVGNGHVVDNSSIGCIVDITEIINKESIAQGIMSTEVGGYTDIGTIGNTFATSVYGQGICIDAVDGITGTSFGVGTKDNPVNNIDDAIVIANKFNITVFNTRTSLTIPTGTDISDYTISGHGCSANIITLEDGCITNATVFNGSVITGFLNGTIGVYGCALFDLFNVQGWVEKTIIDGDITVYDDITSNTFFNECMSRNPIGPIVDIGSSKTAFSDFIGNIQIAGKDDDTHDIGISIGGGNLSVLSTCVSGSIGIIGSCIVEDESGVGCSVDITQVFNNASISTSVWDRTIVTDAEPDTYGEILQRDLYGGVIHIASTLNGGVSGSVYPIGTSGVPVDNLTDAIILSQHYEFDTLHIHDEYTTLATDDISNLTIKGGNNTADILNVTAGTLTELTAFNNLTVTGATSGTCRINKCHFHDITNFDGEIHESVMDGNLSLIPLNGTHTVTLYDCYSGTVGAPPVLDMGGDGPRLGVRGFYGVMIFTNKSGDAPMFVDSDSARFEFTDTITSGPITMKGVGTINPDNSADTVIINDNMINQDNVTRAVWDADVNLFTRSTTTGYAQKSVLYIATSVHIDTALATILPI